MWFSTATDATAKDIKTKVQSKLRHAPRLSGGLKQNAKKTPE